MTKLRRSFTLLATTVALLSSGASLPGDACCSLHRAHFSSTIGYAGETTKDGKVVHLLGYQNTVVNRNAKGGNAMLLPIPAVKGTMTKSNILDTSKAKHILEDMRRAVSAPPAGRGMVVGGAARKSAAPVQVFEHDIYTIVLAQDANAIPAALSQVPQSKRPAMNKEIFDAYAKWYPGWTFALCCFDTKDEAKACPMLWWYKPVNAEELFFPALDAHDGRPPALDAEVEVDHALIASSNHMRGNAQTRAESTSEPTPPIYDMGHPVTYYDEPMPASLKTILPARVIGKPLTGSYKNGDFVFAIKDVRKGDFRPIRKGPPGAN